MRILWIAMFVAAAPPVWAATSGATESVGLRLASAGAQASGNITPESANSGRSTRIVAVNGRLSEVLAHVGRYFNGEIILADENMEGWIVNGVYDLDNPALALQAIVSPLGGQVTEVTPWMLIVSSE